MQVKELIEILSKHPNPEAKIFVTVNTEDVDNDEADVQCSHIEVWNEDGFFHDFVEFFVTNQKVK